MDWFAYQGGELFCEELRLADVAARFGTPAYVYSQQTLARHFNGLRDAFAELEPLICFSVKACQNVHILRQLQEWGSGFDVVSGGELFRAQQAGADPASIVYAGVGKTDKEIREALAAGIGLLNVESESEAQELAKLAAETGVVANGALRINPDVDPHTHEYTTTGKKETKFGVDWDRAVRVFRQFADSDSLKLRGVHLHIGSPVNDVSAYVQAIERALALMDALRSEGIETDTIDIGGGYGAHYEGSEAPPPSAYADAIVPLLRGRGLRVILEPGRSIAANAGILLTQVLHVKESGRRRFVIVDAAVTDLIRPAIYQAYHFAWPVAAGAFVPQSRIAEQPIDGLLRCDVVGPVCESSDFLAKDRLLPPVKRGDLLAVFSAGAYAATMASNYNSRLRAPEVLVEGQAARLVRRRETYGDLVRVEEEIANCELRIKKEDGAAS